MTRDRPPRGALAPLAALLAAARAALAVPVGYLTVLTAAAWWGTLRRRRGPAVGEPATRFAVLVPAHDEELVIGDTVRALQALDYPADRYEVHVIADHCTDRTADVARAAGVLVHERAGELRGKGPSLQWAVTHAVAGDVDAVVVVDADTIVDPAFLRRLDPWFAAGETAVQGQYRVRDPGESVGSGLRAAALALRHHLRPLGRTTLGASCGLYGNGMAFTPELLRRRGFSGHLTEDAELQTELLLDGTLVAYAPLAVVEAAMPATLADARTQNERWERGRLDVARRYLGPLTRLARDGRGRQRVAAVDAVLDHLVPPLSVLVIGVTGTAAGGAAVAVARRRPVPAGAPALVAALGVHVVSGLVLARVPASVYRALLHAPAMVAWKMGLWARMLVGRGPDAWVRTARAGEVRS